MRINAVVPQLKKQIGEPNRAPAKAITGRLHGRREDAPGHPDRRRATSTPRSCCASRACCRGREPVRPGQHHADAPPERGAARARTSTTATHYIVQRRRSRSSSTSSPAALMPGRRWSDGLHQAVEAKEGVPIQSENQTLASITFQNYFRMYSKLVRHDRHGRHRGLRVPADLRPRSRRDPDEPADDPQGPARTSSTRPRSEKYKAVIEDIRDCHKRGQPVLVGTTSIENSELLSGLLQEGRASPHEVLNAKQHEREARDRRAGRPAGRDHHRHQHGRPRHRHRARRQRREPDRAASTPTSRSPPTTKQRARRSCATNGRAATTR